MAIAAYEAPEGATVLYGRVSDDRADNLAVDRQLEDCWRLVNERGWGVDPITDVYRDDGFSASRRRRKQRPRFDAMLERIADGGVRRIVVWASDRLYRDPRDLLRLMDLAERGVEVVTVTGGDLDLNTDDGRMRSGIMVYVAQREADGISTRVKRQKKQRRDQGLPHGSPRPFGWRTLMEPEPVEAAAVASAMEAVVHGASMYDVAADWNARGLRRPRGRTSWTGGDARRVLQSPRHAGLVIHNGAIAEADDGGEIRAAWPAIVSRDLWDACQAVLSARAVGIGVPRRRSTLTGLIRCGACGQVMTRSTTGGRLIWRCWSGKGGCGKVSIGAKPLEAVITEALFAYVEGPALAEALDRRDDHRVRQLREQLGALELRRRELIEAFANGGDAKTLRMAADALDAKTADLQKALASASRRSPLDGMAGAGLLRGAWPSMTLDQRRAAIAAAFGVVTVKPAVRRGSRFDASRVVFGSAPRR